MKKENLKNMNDIGAAEALKKHFPSAVESAELVNHEAVVYVRKDDIKKVLAYLKEKVGFEYLFSITGVDYPDRTPRFDIVYHLKTLEHPLQLTIKVKVEEGTDVDSVYDIFKSANWCEREAYDMVGVPFKGHPNMTRLFMWEGFEGYPLRKDFPLYTEDK